MSRPYLDYTKFISEKEFKNCRDELANMLFKLESDMRSYQTDIYLYWDKEAGTLKLDEFANPGGSSWINDDHYRIYSDYEHNLYDDVTGCYNEESALCDAAGIDLDETIDMISEKNETDPKDVEYFDIWLFIKENYLDDVLDSYKEELKMYGEYIDRADAILKEWVNDYIPGVYGNFEIFDQDTREVIREDICTYPEACEMIKNLSESKPAGNFIIRDSFDNTEVEFDNIVY